MPLDLKSLKRTSEVLSTQPWFTTEPPNDFYVKKLDWSAILWAILNRKNVLLTGPSGAGKTDLIYHAGKALGYNVVPFNCGAMSEPRTTLIGNVHFDKEKGTWFSESRFVKAIQTPKTIVLLDEISRCPPSALNIFLPLLDHQAYLPLDEADDARVVKKNPDVCFAMTANVGMEFVGAMAIDVAFLNRCAVTIDIEFPNPESEIQVLMTKIPGLPESAAKILVGIANDQRNEVKMGNATVPISVRMLLAASHLVISGFSIKDALLFTIENQYSSVGGDSSDRANLRKLISGKLP